MKSRGIQTVIALAAVVALAGALRAQTPAGAATRKGTIEHIKVHGKALEGNLEGDSPDRDVFIYLPPSYGTNTTQRYPVVYLLHGYGLTAERWMPFTKLAEAADKDIAAGTAKEMIFVNPDAHTIYDGSMYSSSPTIGDWETYIAEDLVSYVDSHYRTIADRMSRGLGGHSMGGYGTLRIGMKRPDVFSSLYAMSSCCLMNNPGGGGQAGNRGAAAPAATTPNQGVNVIVIPGRGATTTPVTATPAAPAPAAGAAAGTQGARGGARGGGGFANVQSAEAAAWSSNPRNPPTYFDMPTQGGIVNPTAAAKWVANSPLVMVDQYLTNLKKYQAIMIDVGLQDTLAASNMQLTASLNGFNIRHTFETYEGDHTNHVPERIEQRVLPFFSANLTFGKK